MIKFRALFANEHGSVAVLFAMMTGILIMSAGLAVDMNRTSDVQSRAQAAIDAAVMAVATSGDQSKGVKAFRSNLGSTEERLLALAGHPDIKIDSATGTVTGTVQVKVDTTLLSALGKTIVVTAKSAVQVQSTTGRVCILALNVSRTPSISLQGTADIVAPDCAVRANSNSAAAVETTGSSHIAAGHICARGGFSGSGYTPSPESGCAALGDPFSGLIQTLADAAPCGTASSITWGPNGTATANPVSMCGTFNVLANTTLTLAPGVYFVSQLVVESGSTLQGDGVTIILRGTDSWMNIQGGASIKLKAPTAGMTAGIVIAQDPRSLRMYASRDNTIIGGGLLEPEGMIYLPARELHITGNGKIADTVPAFAVVVDHLVMQGNGLLSMRGGADFEASGFPPLVSGGGPTRIKLIQ
jgi:Flp pilus assembly protein TadG